MAPPSLRMTAVAIAALTSLGGVSTGHAAGAVSTLSPGTMTVCAFTGFPPTSYEDASGRWLGLDATFLRAFARSQGLAVTVRESRAFDGIWRRPGAGECDIAAAGITITDTRAAQAGAAVFSTPYHQTLRAFVVRRGVRLTGVAGLAGRTVLVGKGTIAEQDVRDRVRRARVAGVRIRFGTGEESNRQAVVAGRAFAYETDDLSARQAARANPRLAVAWVHPRIAPDGRPARESLGYVVRSASTGLVQALNAYIATNARTYAP